MHKQLALGVAAGLLVVGGQAYTRPCPGTPTPISMVFIAGHTCTIGDKTFSAFSLGLPIVDDANSVDFSEHGSNTTITLIGNSHPSTGTGHGFGPGDHSFGFDVTVDAPAAAAGTRIVSYTIMGTAGGGSPVATGTIGPHSISFTGNTLGTGHSTLDVSPGVTSDSVELTTTQAGGNSSRFSSITQTFGQRTVSAAVPEPISLSLFGLGLTGLWFAGRRRRS